MEILPEYTLGLFKLDSISHAFILWWINENDVPSLRIAKDTVLPRVSNTFTSYEMMGTFATRNPFRPNPIGLTLVKIHKIKDNKIYLDTIDAFEGTPVIDIKPYLPNMDRVEDDVHLPPLDKHLLKSRPSDMSNQ